MYKLSFVFAALVFVFLTTGCADLKTYLKDRGNDFADCFAGAVGRSYGLGVRVQVTDFVAVSVGGAFDEKKVGFYGREEMVYETEWWAGLPIPQFAAFYLPDSLAGFLLIFSLTDVRQDYDESPPIPDFWALGVGVAEIWGDCYDFVNSRGPPENKGDYWIGFSATLGAVGFDFGFNPVEFADFLLGWFGLDIAGDDAWKAKQLAREMFQWHIQRLVRALKDQDRTVRRRAAEELKRITGLNLGENYDKWKQWSEKNKGE